MTMSKRVYCAWCGEDIGESVSCFREMESCGKSECEREVRAMQRAETEQAQFNAELDDWERYR
jgi:hypothetical protein